MHAELTLRGTTLVLGPENPQMGGRSAKSLGGSPVTLYMTTESVDKLVAKAVELGATVKVAAGEMLWGDRSGTIVDPEGHTWMVATHVADPTPQEMMKKMKEMSAQARSAASSSTA
jgi:PhnB protein